MSGPDSLPTVKIKHPGGYAIINESDFVEGEHELFVEKPETDEEKKAREDAEAKAAAEAADKAAPRDAKGLRLDGPTEAEYRKAGYTGSYPPKGYAAKPEVKTEAPPAAEPQKQAGWGVAPPPAA